MIPEFLAVGHVARDLTPQGATTIGGTVAYGALTALKMGLRTAVVTSAGRNLDVATVLAGVEVRLVPSAETTTFHYPQVRGKRKQFLRSVAGPIAESDLPVEWRRAPLVLLGPLFGELGCDLAGLIPGSLTVASIQGWLRQCGSGGLVSPRYWEGRAVLPHLDAAVVSTDDIVDERLIDLWADITNVLIVTSGAEGARLHFQGKWHEVPAFQTREVDPTGAGDVFAAAYLIRLRECHDPLESARFASCAASFSVEARGLACIPTRTQVERRLSGQHA